MSWLSVGLADIGKFLTSAAASPTATPAAKTALADVTTAAASVQAAVPDLITSGVDAGVNALVSQIPIIGGLAEPEFDAIANAFLAALYAKYGLTPKTVAA